MRYVKLFEVGERVYSWRIIGESKRRGSAGQVYWDAECLCGRRYAVRGDNLRLGGSRQCLYCAKLERRGRV